MVGYVYRIIAPGSNSVYVGQSLDPVKRFKQHKKSQDNPALSRFLKKHADAEIYFWPAINMADEEIADEQLCRDMGFSILNCAPCGGRPPNTVESRSKRAAALRGRKHTLETRTKMSASRAGKTHTSPEQIEADDAMRGEKKSPETRAKMSAWQVGRKLSVEHRAKLSEAHKGQVPSNKGEKHSPEARAKMRASAKERKRVT